MKCLLAAAFFLATSTNANALDRDLQACREYGHLFGLSTEEIENRCASRNTLLNEAGMKTTLRGKRKTESQQPAFDPLETPMLMLDTSSSVWDTPRLTMTGIEFESPMTPFQKKYFFFEYDDDNLAINKGPRTCTDDIGDEQYPFYMRAPENHGGVLQAHLKAIKHVLETDLKQMDKEREPKKTLLELKRTGMALLRQYIRKQRALQSALDNLKPLYNELLEFVPKVLPCSWKDSENGPCFIVKEDRNFGTDSEHCLGNEIGSEEDSVAESMQDYFQNLNAEYNGLNVDLDLNDLMIREVSGEE